MKTNQVLKIGFHKFSFYTNIRNFSPERYSPRILLADRLGDYLVKNSNYFDYASYFIADEPSYTLPNGTFTGLKGLINRSEIDVAVDPHTMTTKNSETSDFAYPFKLYNYGFMTQKPEYIPQIFDIFHTFSTPVWIGTLLLFIIMLIIYYFTFKRNYSFDKILLHVFAIFLKQGSIIRSSSVTENLLLYSLVIGVMFMVLLYESTVLCFLTIPPINKISDVSQLAAAVANGEYHCIAFDGYGIYRMLLRSEREELRVIGRDLQNSKLNDYDLYGFIKSERSKKNLAFVAYTEMLEMNKIEGKFISEDRFLEIMAAMMIRKGFCCKKLVEAFIHRYMASGIFYKDKSDNSFLHRLTHRLIRPKKDTSKRRLTLVDFAPAFIFLLIGYFISFMVLIGEVLLNRNMAVKFLKTKKKRKNIISCYEEPV